MRFPPCGWPSVTSWYSRHLTACTLMDDVWLFTKHSTCAFSPRRKVSRAMEMATWHVPRSSMRIQRRRFDTVRSTAWNLTGTSVLSRTIRSCTASRSEMKRPCTLTLALSVYLMVACSPVKRGPLSSECASSTPGRLAGSGNRNGWEY